MKRTHPSIDLLKLLSGKEEMFIDSVQFPDENFAIHKTITKRLSSSHSKWNDWLKKCLDTKNLDDLIRVRYGIQVGMDDLSKIGLNTAAISEMYCRWIGSIDKTARKVIKKKNPFPNLNKITDPTIFKKVYKVKKIIDSEFEVFLRKASF